MAGGVDGGSSESAPHGTAGSTAQDAAAGAGAGRGPAAEEPARAASESRTIWVCDMHPENVSSTAGDCEKCGGMALQPRTIPPGAQLYYSCPVHPDVRAGEPGECTVAGCGRKLAYKIASPLTRVVEAWICSLHPLETATEESTCARCGDEMKRFELEQVLALPFSAVIDTGMRKVVYIHRGAGVFEAVEVKLGPRAGERYQVLGGLSAGDRVVNAGAFLVDAEARLNPAAGVVYFGASGHEDHR